MSITGQGKGVLYRTDSMLDLNEGRKTGGSKCTPMSPRAKKALAAIAIIVALGALAAGGWALYTHVPAVQHALNASLNTTGIAIMSASAVALPVLIAIAVAVIKRCRKGRDPMKKERFENTEAPQKRKCCLFKKKNDAPLKVEDLSTEDFHEVHNSDTE